VAGFFGTLAYMLTLAIIGLLLFVRGYPVWFGVWGALKGNCDEG